MRIVVVGGSGRIGSLAVDLLLRNGHRVVATIRNRQHGPALVAKGAEVAIIDLDGSPRGEIEQAFAVADAIVFAAGAAEGDPSSAVDRNGVERTVLAATKLGVRRYVAISGLGATTATPPSYDWPGMAAYFAAKRAANDLVRNANLDWTILEPGSLTDGPLTDRIALSEGIDIADGRIARVDVAAVVAAVLEEPRSAGHTFQIVGGNTRIHEAVKTAVASGKASPR